MSCHSFRRLPASLGVLFSLLTLTSCGSSGFSYQNVTVTVTPQIVSVPVNGTVTFTSTVANAPPGAVWLLNGGFGGNSNAGSLSLSTPAITAVYTAPASPPIYNDGTDVNGTVTLEAVVFLSFTTEVSTTLTFVITAPSVTAAITPLTAAVPLNSTAQFTAYAVGNINNAITVQVNGVTGGSTSTGTIVAKGTLGPGGYLYTAPATMPMSGSTVTITVISQADPTKTQTAIVTLQ